MPPGLDVAKPLKQRLCFLRVPRLRGELGQPLAEGGIESFALGARNHSGLLD